MIVIINIVVQYTPYIIVRSQQLATRMATSSQMEMFDSRRDDWDSWSRRFDQWLSMSPYAAGDDADTKKRAAFCTFVGSETFKLLCTLCMPAKPEECTYETLKTKLNSQFGVKKLVLVERYRFYAYKQQDKQSLSDYLAELCHLASTCQWSEGYLADNLCDKFVMGLRNERLVCCSKTAVVTQQQLDKSAVVPISQSSKQLQNDIPPMFQILHLTEKQKRLCLMVDSASPITFINVKTWQDLEKPPKLQSTDRVLGAFKGQPIKPLGYFLTPVLREDDTSKSAILPIHVSQRG